MHRRHKDTASSRAASTSTGRTSRYDMVTGTLNPIFSPLSPLASPDRLTSQELPPNHRGFSLDDEDERTAELTSSQMNQVVSAISSLPAILKRDVTQTKVLHTQVPIFRVSKNKFNEFELLLLNHLRTHQHKITEQNKLHYSQSFLRDEP